MATFISNSVASTQQFAAEFARNLVPGSVVALVWPLGSGKTHFVKGMVQEIGGPAAVTSPTFTLIHEYTGGRLPVYHFDFFRIEDRPSAERLGLDEYFFGDGICAVEWADKFRELLPAEASWISFDPKAEGERLITIS